MNFVELRDKQRELDELIARPRTNGFVPVKPTLAQIRLSALAETIEFQEELETTHKVWKNKTEFDKQKQLEEFVDILFFLLKWANIDTSGLDVEHLIVKGIKQRVECVNVNEWLLELQGSIAYGLFNSSFIKFGIIASCMGYTKEMIVNEYLRKWEINKNRIEGEWK